jgi:serine/threonine protein kinase
MATDASDNDQTRSFRILTVGATVAHYKIISRLGAGGMGEVYLAEDTRLRRKVGLKFLSTQFATDRKLKARFTREARAAAALKHANIVIIHEVAEYEGRPYIAMEYVDGESLRDIIHHGRLNAEKSLEIMAQLCSGLLEAHNAGIVHRDIKPSNIMFDRKGSCRILDFGLAKGTGDSQNTSPGSIMGTASYMSPEQGQGLDVDHRGDIFSLGVVFYEMLTGCSPFKRANIPATISAVVHDQPERLAQYFDCDTDCWQQIIDRMLAKTPSERYQSTDSILADLNRLKTGEKLPQLSEVRVLAHQEVRALAVLYLRNLGSNEDEYLSYGITEDLIVDLTRIGSIRVAPMRSVLKFKDSDRELDDIARALDVSLILDG